MDSSTQDGDPAGADSARPSAGGIALVGAIAFVWGLNWPAIRITVQEISPWTFRAVCLVLATAVLFGISLASRTRIAIPKREIAPLALVAFFNVTAWHMLTAFGLTIMEASRGILLAFTFPVWSVLIGAVVLRERLTPGRLVALALGLAAMVLLMGAEITRVGGAPLGGALLVGAAISWAVATAMLKRIRWTLGSRELAAWQVLIGGLPIVVGALVFDGPTDFTALSTPAVVGLIYSSVIAAAIGQWIWFRIVDLMPASVASISSLAIPVVGVFSSALLLGEAVTWRELAALALVLAALSIILLGGRGMAAWRRAAGRNG
jgi:drug/metabolite transporter (DMT)-like permease